MSRRTDRSAAAPMPTTGFTLLEVVLSLVIFSFLTLMVYGAFFVGHRAVLDEEFRAGAIGCAHAFYCPVKAFFRGAAAMAAAGAWDGWPVPGRSLGSRGGRAAAGRAGGGPERGGCL